MTTDHDLLAKIDEKALPLNFQLGYGVRLNKAQTLEVKDNNKALLNALRAVVELHKPEPTRDYCLEGANYVPYPCPTIQAIEKELG